MRQQEHESPDQKRLVVWAITDGRAGNEAQALGLAEAIGRARPTEIVSKTVDVVGAWAAAPTMAWDAAGRIIGFDALKRALADRGAALSPPWPTLAIGAGRRSAPFVAGLRSASGGVVKAIQLLDPQMSPQRFDLVVAPAHDRLRATNALTTLGSLNRVDRHAEIPPDARLSDLRRPLTAVLVGGASKSATFAQEDLDLLVSAILEAGRAGGVAVTASRRTPEAYRARLAAAAMDAGGFYWDGSGDNPYRAMLAAADALIVTADSVNMASEAATTGKPVRIAPLSKLSPKLRRFHAALEASGHARPLEAPIDGWTPTPLDDAAPIVAAALALLDA